MHNGVIVQQPSGSVYLIVLEAGSAVHNGVVVQQLYIARLQLEVHAQLVTASQAVELRKGCFLQRRQAGNLLVPLTELVVVVSIEAAQMTLQTQKQVIRQLCGSCIWSGLGAPDKAGSSC